ncbi:MAG: hypothetical protein H0T44_04435 [Gemmatimonadales bacterium]|nr:hypothetical protein [Gemmatimonadales bacterium]
MSSTSLSYRAAVRLGTALAPALAHYSPKVREGHRARLGAGGRLCLWARESRDPQRPLVWLHASSVGEGLQAESVLGELRRVRPDCQYVYTHFSSSAAPLALRLAADVADYLPYDLRGQVDRLLDALAPDLLVFVKLDLWPELATRAAARGTAVAIVAGTVSSSSGRLRWPARSLLRAGYEAVAAAGVISHEDGERLTRLGVDRNRVEVLGDPRFDSVLHRVRAVSAQDPLLALGSGAPTMVAGSTWPGDEAVLLGAFTRIRRDRPEARLILVPHEPTPDNLAAVERAAAGAGLPRAVRLETVAGPAPLLLVDRVGILAALYGGGTMAYVGGGFGRAGLHSVLEPAAWGLPVIFGPRWESSRDAGLLLRAGAAEALPASGAREAGAALYSRWKSWLDSEPLRQSQGGRAREVVERGTGAARRSAELLDRLTPRRRHPYGRRTG